MNWQAQRSTPRLSALVVACIAAAVFALLVLPAPTRAAGGVQVETGSTECHPLAGHPPYIVDMCGTVTIEGGGSGTYFFEFGRTRGSYEYAVPAEPGKLISTTATEPSEVVSAEANGFGPGSTFFYRLVAIVGDERIVGDVIAFTLAPEPPEKPVTEACPGPAPSGGIWMACGTVSPHEDFSGLFRFRFNQGPDCEGGWITPAEEVEGEAVPVSAELPGLLPDTKYTYCLEALNPGGTELGDGLSFVTTLEPDPIVGGGGSAPAGTSPPPGGGETGIAPPPIVASDEAQASTIRLRLKHALQRCAKRSGSSRAVCARKARHRFQLQLRAAR